MNWTNIDMKKIGVARTNVIGLFFTFLLGVLIGKYLFPVQVYTKLHEVGSPFEIENFNETGFRLDFVPNVVHYVLFTIHEIEFAHFISMLSVLKNQKPERIYIHCDCNQLSGDYYQRVLRVANKTNTPITIRTIERSTHIFGQKLSRTNHNWHLSDITRIRVLQEFGGIYLDNDVYVVKSLDVFRKYEMTLNWDEGQSYGTQTLIAHKNARFLKLWLESYHDYRPDLWYYNAGFFPTQSILTPRPDLVHRLKGGFGADGDVVCSKIYREYYENWEKDFYSIHLLIRGNQIPAIAMEWCFGTNIPPIAKFDDQIASGLNVTLGEMTRILFDFENRLNKNV